MLLCNKMIFHVPQVNNLDMTENAIYNFAFEITHDLLKSMMEMLLKVHQKNFEPNSSDYRAAEALLIAIDPKYENDERIKLLLTDKTHYRLIRATILYKTEDLKLVKIGIDSRRFLLKESRNISVWLKSQSVEPF